MWTASCDFIFVAVHSSAVQDRSRNKRPPQSPSSPPDKGQNSKSVDSAGGHCMNSSAAYEYAEPSGVTPSVFGSPSRSPKSKTRAPGRVVEKVWKCSGDCTSSTGRATGDAHELSRRLDDASSILRSLRGTPRYGWPETPEGAIMPQQPTRNRGNGLKSTGLDAMPVEIPEMQAANRGAPSRIDARSPGEDVSVEDVTKSSPITPPSDRQPRRRRRLLIGV